MNEEITERELELFDGVFNKGWTCDLDEVYHTAVKILRLYNQEKEKNKKLEEVIDMMTEDILLLCNIAEELAGIGVRVPITGGKEAVKEYYFNKTNEENNILTNSWEEQVK